MPAWAVQCFESSPAVRTVPTTGRTGFHQRQGTAAPGNRTRAVEAFVSKSFAIDYDSGEKFRLEWHTWSLRCGQSIRPVATLLT